MIIYPSIELQNGKCVNLIRGKMNDPVVYDVVPLEAAKSFEAQGAEWLHIIDLDGAGSAEQDNSAIICEIIENVSIPVQVGGGVRTISAVDGWRDKGAARVIIGTAAVKDPSFVSEACGRHPRRIVISVDARSNRVVCEGWTETTSYEPIAFAQQFEHEDPAAVIFTDIDLDEDLPEASLSMTTEMARLLSVPVIASGMVKQLDDISTLKYLPNIDGAVTGRALFGNQFALSDAVEIARA